MIVGNFHHSKRQVMLFQFFKLNMLTFLFESQRQVLVLKVFLLSHGVLT